MGNRDRPPLPPGSQPYDRLNGIRIGALTGGVIAIIPAFVFGGSAFWLLGGGLAGGVAGYLWERGSQIRKLSEGP